MLLLKGTAVADVLTDEGAYPSQMILSLIFPLLSNALFPVLPIEEHIEKTQHLDTTNQVLCSCVDFVRQLRPDLPSMDASSFSVSTTTIRKGDAVKMRYPSGAWHLAYASDVVGDQVLLMHANVVPCQESSEWRSVHDTRILGSI